MKRKFLLFAFLLASTLRGHAQDATSALNKIMSGFAVPLFIALTLFAVVLGLSQKCIAVINIHHFLCCKIIFNVIDKPVGIYLTKHVRLRGRTVKLRLSC